MFFFLVPFQQNILSADGSLTLDYESVNPSDDYRYVLKRLKEKILLLVYSYSPSKKADYYLELTNNRLAELKHIVDKKDIANIETGSNRYSATIGELTQFINENDLINKKGGVKETLAVHIKILELLRDKFPGGAGWLFIQQNIDSTKINLEKIQ